jgi:hypothetical protein
MAPSLFDKRVKQAVTEALTPKGMIRQNIDPDILVVYHVDVQNKREIHAYGYRYGWGPAQIDTYDYREGTLIIDFVDRQTKQLVWRSVGSGVIDREMSPQEMQAKINKAVAKMLAKFPPQR